MKNVCLILYILSLILSVSCFFYILKRRGRLENTLRHMLVLSSFITLSYIFVLIAREPEQARVAHSLKSLFTMWLLAFLAHYSARFIEKYRGKDLIKEKFYKPISYAVLLLLILNSALWVLNAFRPYLTDVSRQWFQGEMFFTVSRLQPRYYLQAFTIFALILINCVLIYKSNKAVSKAYWQRYRALLTIFYVGIIIVILQEIAKFNYIDIYILTYGMFAYHMASVNLYPSRFSAEMNWLLIDAYTSGILVFDSKDTLVLYNKKSSELFSLTKDMLRNLTLEKFAERNCLKIELAQSEEDGFFYDMEKDGERLYFFVRCSRIYDKKGLYVGSFIIFEDETVQRMLLGRQRFLTDHDQLTGILNRNAFSARTEALLKNNPDTDYVFIQFDIDNFRIINQLFGSRAGNALLQAIADYLKGYVKNGTYARLEADHFAICIPENEMDLEELSDGISRCVNEIGINLQLRASFGLYKIEDRTIPVEHMYDMAVMASKTVKGSYWEYFAYYDGKMHESILQEQEIIGEMEYALRNGQFEVLLQPQYHYVTGEIVGAEALVRWNHPEKGIVLPMVFIPIFEKNGFIAQLDQYVWESACGIMKKWSEEESPLRSMSLSVNISRVDFYRMDLCGALVECVKKYGVEPRRLRLEVTETACIENPEHMISIIKELQSYGFLVEMDDFGSGYSSLNILKNMPVNVLKLDMNFISGDGDLEKGYSILSSIINMANMINLSIIAEGVETRDQAEFLHEIGCDIMQGYYYAPPMSLEEFENLLKENNETEKLG